MNNLRSKFLMLALLFGAGCAPDSDDTVSTESPDSLTSALEAARYFYLRCNSTGWNANADTRMRVQSDGALALTFDVEKDWMLASGDDCVLTETPVEDGWGPEQTHYRPRAKGAVSVPSSVRMREAARSKAHFKVRYPELGRYTARFDLTQFALDFGSAVSAQPGEELWAQAGGSVIVKQGAILARRGADSLVRLDPKSGRTLWATQTELFPLAGCVDADTAVAIISDTDGRFRVSGIDVETGAIRFSRALQVPEGQYPELACAPERDYASVSWGETLERHTLVNTKTGRVVFRKNIGPYATVAFAGQEVIIYEWRENAEAGGYIALDPSDGRLLWERGAPSETWDVTEQELIDAPQDALFMFDHPEGRVLRLDPSTGRTLWTFSANARASLSFRFGRLSLATYDGDLYWLNPATGAIATQVDLRPYRNGPGGIGLLPSGLFFLNEFDPQSGEQQLSVFDPQTGALRFSRRFAADAQVNLTEQAGALYLYERDRISGLDPTTGSTRFSYIVPELRDQVVFAGRIGSVYGNADGKSVSFTASLSAAILSPSALITLDRATGEVLWRYETLFGVSGESDDAFFLSVYPEVVRALAR